MDLCTDTHPIQDAAVPNTLSEGLALKYGDESGNVALNENSVLDDLNIPCSAVHSSLVMNGGNNEVHEAPIHPLRPDQELPDTEAPRNDIYHEDNSAHPQSNSNQIVLLTIPKVTSRTLEVRSFQALAPPKSPRSEDAPVNGSTTLTKINGLEGYTIVCSGEPSSLHAAGPLQERRSSSDGRLDCVQTPYTDTELDHAHSDGVALVTEAHEDFDYHCEDLPSSLPPSSSPPQLFPSSPYGSSQSSIKSAESLKMVPVVEVEGDTSPRNLLDDVYVTSATQYESLDSLEPKSIHGNDITNDITSLETGNNYLQVETAKCAESGSGLSGKRITHEIDPDGPYESRQTKCPKLDHLLPPTPKRPTLASQRRQFKKLATPFRPPLKLSVVVDGSVQSTNYKETETIISTPCETSAHEIKPTGFTTQLFPSKHKAPNTSRSTTQFKSPLVNKDLPADTRTIRLTPAVQALERKLQLLKRAVKVKEDKDEDALTRLAKKWIEAGREVAYDVWNATKDAIDFEGKATLVHRSFGWETTNTENAPRSWNVKLEGAGEESCDLDPALSNVGRLTPEEDNVVSYNTVGNMLRQLGITPEIFGWDDDSETFSD